MTGQKSKIEDLITDLMYLRKGPGFTDSRVYQANTFIKVIDGKNQIFENIKILFTTAIKSLPDKQNVEALLVAYGLLPGYDKIALLKDRREKYGNQLNRKYDMLTDREASAIQELAIRLLTAYCFGVLLPAELPVPHGGLLIDYLSVTTFIQDHLFLAHQQVRRVISLANGAKSFEYQSNERTKINPLSGIKVETRYVENGSIHRLLFPKPLKRGQTHKFSFLETPEALNHKNNEDFAGQSFETPALTYKQTVVFKDEKPAVIWSYDKLSQIKRPGEPTDKNRLEINKDGIVEKEFTQLYGGLHSGIAWRWK